jgi:hypothetical protein
MREWPKRFVVFLQTCFLPATRLCILPHHFAAPRTQRALQSLIYLREFFSGG